MKGIEEWESIEDAHVAGPDRVVIQDLGPDLLVGDPLRCRELVDLDLHL